MIKLLPTNLIAIVVPLKAIIGEPNESNEAYYSVKCDFGGYLVVPLWKGKIIGEVTADNVSFDVDECLYDYVHEKYCKPKHHGYCEDYCQGGCYKDVVYNEEMYSLLESNGLYFTNPITEPQPEDYSYSAQIGMDTWEEKFDSNGYNGDKSEWKAYEDKLITGKILILEKQ